MDVELGRHCASSWIRFPSLWGLVVAMVRESIFEQHDSYVVTRLADSTQTFPLKSCEPCSVAHVPVYAMRWRMLGWSLSV